MERTVYTNKGILYYGVLSSEDDNTIGLSITDVYDHSKHEEIWDEIKIPKKDIVYMDSKEVVKNG